MVATITHDTAPSLGALALAVAAAFAPTLVFVNSLRPPARPTAVVAAPAAAAVVAATPGPIPAGPLGDAIRRGEQIATRTWETVPDHVGNRLHCTSCHMEGGRKADAIPWTGVVGVFPEYRARSGRVDTIERRINDCFERSMDGTALDPGSEDMAALVAYMGHISRGVPAGTTPPGRGVPRITPPPSPDRARGATLYAQRCVSCHGADGAGQYPSGSYQFPALWGDAAYNLGAGMARLDTAAAFIRANMPLGQGGTLSAQEAYDVADYVIHQPRPDWAGAARDWPHGGKPRDARY